MKTRTVFVVAMVLAMATTSALPALAQDLEEWLERAAGAEYSGRQFTLCDTPDGHRVEIVEVVQSEGLLEVRASFGSAVVTPDGIYQRSSDGAVSVSSAEAVTGWQLAEHYRVEFGAMGEGLRRPVDVLQVMDGDLLRMELSFDRQTGAVLEAEVFNADSSRYCTSSFIVFEPGSNDIDPPAMIVQVIESTLVDDDRLPLRLGGFTRKDSYQGPSGSVTGFYSDGLFSFTLVVADRRITVQGLDTTLAARIGGAIYDRAFTPGQSFHSWGTRDGGYVMLGDLPLDLQEQVLSELPKPGKPGFLTRVWRKFFG